MSSTFPKEFKPKNTDKYPIIHIQIDAAFYGDAEKIDRPQTVYATLQKENQIKYALHADYLPEAKMYAIDASLQLLM